MHVFLYEPLRPRIYNEMMQVIGCHTGILKRMFLIFIKNKFFLNIKIRLKDKLIRSNFQ